MASPLTNLLASLSPPLIRITPDYDGLEYRWKMLTFRPALLKNELYLLSAVLLYFAFYYFGKKSNEKRAKSWFDIHLPLYETQFSKPVQAGGLIQDGYSDFFAFSTGRRAVSSLHTTLTLRPRHDLFQYAFQFFRGLIELDYKVGDELELDFTFREKEGSPSVPECVWAIVAKDELRTIKERRWDLTLAKTSDNPRLPSSLAVMSEFADITENILKPHGTLDLAAILSHPALLPHFRSLSLTDHRRARPTRPIPRTKHLILSLHLPPAHLASDTLPLVAALFQLVDIISGVGPLVAKSAQGQGLNASLRPETRAKLRKVREEVDREIREEAEREKKEEAAEEKAAAKKKAEDERLSRLSAADQKKALEREKKRALRKSQGKMKVR